MAIIPRYYCDHCGFAFTHPRSLGWFGVRGRDEHDEDERCPRCANPDFEVLVDENENNYSGGHPRVEHMEESS